LSEANSERGVVLVTHHVEEIPASSTHVLLLREGRRLASGPINDTLTSDNLSTCFDFSLDVLSHNGRFLARAR
jgi:iron complex transport system ATP-binding protein